MTNTADTAVTTFEAAWNEWHRERERYYSDPLGWVSLTGLYWLTDEFDTVADLPGAGELTPMRRTSRRSTEPNGSNRPRAHQDYLSRQVIAASR